MAGRFPMLRLSDGSPSAGALLGSGTIVQSEAVPAAQARGNPCGILSPRTGADGPRRVIANPGGMMPEILTESFCERCGTRYTFESAAPRKARRLGQFKTLSKGMKNWVLSDDSSLDEAMAAARNDEERELTSQQLDAFHSTFNFCMTCRQYTCGNCWNTAEGRCLTTPHSSPPGSRPKRGPRSMSRPWAQTATAMTDIRLIPIPGVARPMSRG